jgi:hypothetical protein
MVNWLFRCLGLSSKNISQDTFSDFAASSILLKRNVGALKELFAGIPKDWSQRYFYSLALSRQFPDKKLEEWVKEEPDSADSHLVYGARLLKMAWDARGYGKGKDVSEDRWMKFYHLLDEAEDSLLRAAKLNGEDPTPWVYLIMVAVYRSSDESLEEQYFDEAIARDPENWHAHMNRLTGLSKKYGGSHHEMFEFARGVRKNVSDKSLLHCLIFKAHSEYWKYTYHFEGDAETAELHQRNPDVIDECLAAYNLALAGGEYDDHDSIFVRINAAGIFWILSQKEPLKRELQKLGTRIEDIHWRWVGTEGGLDDAKKFALS